MIFQRSCLLTVAVLFLVVSGCARLILPDMPREQVLTAEHHLARYERVNRKVPPYKGIGELSFFSDQGAWSFRGAWLGVPENRFRVESIGIVGQPAARLICDGVECHFIYPENGELRRISSREQNLRRLAGIDMDVSDFLLLLGGGIPIPFHHTAWMEKSETVHGPVIVLQRRFYGEVGRLHLSPDLARMTVVEVYGFRQRKYRAEILSTRLVNGYEVPDLLRIEGDDAFMELRVDRAWFDVTYSPEAFVPDLPERGGSN